MAEKPKKKATTEKWKRKLWYTIHAPQSFENTVIGRTVASKPELLSGRVVGVSARDLTNQAKRQYAVVYFKINRVQGDDAYTEAIGHEVRESYLRRSIRRHSSKVETVQDVAAKDGVKFRVKTVSITVKKARRVQETAISKIQSQAVAEFCKEKNASEMIVELVFGNLPNIINAAAKAVVPLKKVEIVKSRLLSK